MPKNDILSYSPTIKCCLVFNCYQAAKIKKQGVDKGGVSSVVCMKVVDIIIEGGIDWTIMMNCCKQGLFCELV